MTYVFLYSKWCALPLPTRHQVARILDIPKIGPTHVQDNIVVADGYRLEDVEKALLPDSLAIVLGVEAEPEVLWTALIERATTPVSEVKPIIPEPLKPEPTQEESNAKPEKVKVIHEPKADAPKKSPAKPRGRPRKVK